MDALTDVSTPSLAETDDFFLATALTILTSATTAHLARRGTAQTPYRDVVTGQLFAFNRMRTGPSGVKTTRPLLLFSVATIHTARSFYAIAVCLAAGLTGLILGRDVTDEPHPKR